MYVSLPLQKVETRRQIVEWRFALFVICTQPSETLILVLYNYDIYLLMNIRSSRKTFGIYALLSN